MTKKIQKGEVAEILNEKREEYLSFIANDPAYIINPHISAQSIYQSAMGDYFKFKPVVDDLGRLRDEAFDQVREFADPQSNLLALPGRTVEMVNAFLNSRKPQSGPFYQWDEPDTKDFYLNMDPKIRPANYKHQFQNFEELVEYWETAKRSIIRDKELDKNVKNPDPLWFYESGLRKRDNSEYHAGLRNTVVKLANAVEADINQTVLENLRPYALLYSNLTNIEALDKAIKIAGRLTAEGTDGFFACLRNLPADDQVDGHAYLSIAEYVKNQYGLRPEPTANKTEPLALPPRHINNPEDQQLGNVRVSELLQTRSGRRQVSGDFASQLAERRRLAGEIKARFAPKPVATRAAKRTARDLVRDAENHGGITISKPSRRAMMRNVRARNVEVTGLAIT